MKKIMYVAMNDCGIPVKIYKDIETAKSKSNVFYAVEVDQSKISIPESAFASVEQETEITRKVKGILANRLDIDKEIKYNDHLGSDYGADSLDRFEIMADIENTFGVAFTEEEGEKIFASESVQDLIDHIITKLNQK